MTCDKRITKIPILQILKPTNSGLERFCCRMLFSKSLLSLSAIEYRHGKRLRGRCLTTWSSQVCTALAMNLLNALHHTKDRNRWRSVLCRNRKKKEKKKENSTSYELTCQPSTYLFVNLVLFAVDL